MRFKMLFVSSCVLAAIAAFEVPGMKAAVHECVPGSPTAASYTWDFNAEANTIFEDLDILARQARIDADQFETYNRGTPASWDLQGDQLETLKQEVNDMGTKLCRLEAIRRVLAPWQQAEVDRIADAVQLMADNTQDAILYLDAHEHELWVPTYQTYASNLYKEAGTLADSVDSAVSYANASKEYQDLRHKLGIRAS